MTPEQHQKAKALFTQALELPQQEVASFVDEACAGDLEVRDEVMSLLDFHNPQDQIAQPTGQHDDPTMTKPPDTASDQGSYGGISSRARFSPGTIIGERYRIVARLGAGSMGEVYQADDLALDQMVALKFLHPLLAQRSDVIQRFRREVKLARQVTHHNVARVYDFVEADGEAFLTMEYIDGENLSSLLRRIGRLPSDKVSDMARQLCNGLAAAHAVGVLHRDLKPGNIMLDGRGQVRITDFGIAALTAESQEAVMVPGTPAYMAPELFKGAEASVASDLYSLGLVLYEMSTGVQALPSDLLQRRAVQTVSREPAELVTQLEPMLNRAILECLHMYPEDRPESALAVMGLLPGGDPLAQALAAGQTPSPELVAQSGADEGLKPWVATVAFGLGLVLLITVVVLADRTFLVPRSGLVNSPQVLEHMAGQIASVLGYPSEGRDTVYGFELNPTFEQGTLAAEQSLDGAGSPADAQAILFWFRRSNKPIIPMSPLDNASLDVHERIEPGDLRMKLDGKGQLLWFAALPATSRPSPLDKLVLPVPETVQSVRAMSVLSPKISMGERRDLDWKIVFSLGGLDFDDYVAEPSREVPPMFADRVFAWESTRLGAGGKRLRVEAATLDGQLVYFHQQAADQVSRDVAADMLGEQIASRVLGLFLFIMTLLSAVALAHRNMALGRIDYRGALRVSAYGAVVLLLAWAFLHRHVPAIEPAAEAVFYNLAMATFFGLMIWVYYIALEPLVRRFWPETIISWSRLVKGSFFDPLVGRDVLIGTVCGIVTVFLFQLDMLLQVAVAGKQSLAMQLPYRDSGAFFTLMGPGKMVGQIFAYQFVAIRAGLLALMLMLLLRVSLRSKHMAAVTFCFVVAVSLTVLSSGQVYFPWVVNVILAVMLAVLVIRGGVLQVIVALFVFILLLNSPLTSQFGRWYAGPAMVALGMVAALLTIGFYTALAGRPVFRDKYSTTSY